MDTKLFAKVYLNIRDSQNMLENCYEKLQKSNDPSFIQSCESKLDKLASDNAHHLRVFYDIGSHLSKSEQDDINHIIKNHDRKANQIKKDDKSNHEKRHSSKRVALISYNHIVPKIINKQGLINYIKRHKKSYINHAKNHLTIVANDYVNDALAVIYDYYHMPDNKPINKTMVKSVKKHYLGSSSSQASDLRHKKSLMHLYNKRTHEHRSVGETLDR